MKSLLKIFFIILLGQVATAQSINIRTWATRQIDSLQQVHVDTIVYYHQFCGGCEVRRSYKYCDVYDNGNVNMESIILYKQSGSFYRLAFNCGDVPDKIELKSCKSIPYFLSITGVLKNRDKAINAIYSQKKFLPPNLADGFYTQAELYCHKSNYRVSLSDYQQRDGYKVWKQYFWIDKEIQLLKLLDADLHEHF